MKIKMTQNTVFAGKLYEKGKEYEVSTDQQKILTDRTGAEALDSSDPPPKKNRQ